MKKKLVVFDLDGTLLDTLPDIRRAINYALSAYDISPINEEETRLYVGHGLRNALLGAVEKSGAHIEENDFSLMNELLLSSYLKHPDETTTPYPGIIDLLLWLEENKLAVAIASNKKDEIVQIIVKDILKEIHFSFVLGQTNKYPLKPNPEGILKEMEKLSITPDEIIYVGDSEVDYETAKNLMCDYVIVNYGFRDKALLEKNGIKESVDDVASLKKRIEALLEK